VVVGIRERLTGAPIIQLCQMQALRASSRWMVLAHSPAGTRPPWHSSPSWCFRVQIMASMRWRSQFGKGRGPVSSLRDGRIRARPSSWLAKKAPVSSPALVRDDGGTGGGPVRRPVLQHLAGLLAFPEELGLARPNPVTVRSQVQISSSLAPQY
jgi:hypothetical protein